jgi:hypothetical protein
MNILLVNTNPVVSRLISLCVRDDDTVFEEVADVDAVALDRYDIVFVDDASYMDGLEDALNKLIIRKKVFLSSKSFGEDLMDSFDEVIKKPFLPSQITTLLESLDVEEIEKIAEKTEEGHFIFPLSSEKNISEDTIETEEPKKAEVLDSSEIERIKALLDDDELKAEPVEMEHDINSEARKVEVITQHLESDGLEIVNEDEYIETLSNKSKKVKNKKKKKNKEETYTFEEALIAAVEGMKVKKIKKLLKDADITISINFKDKK